MTDLEKRVTVLTEEVEELRLLLNARIRKPKHVPEVIKAILEDRLDEYLANILKEGYKNVKGHSVLPK
ncbi:hypothetical protein LCGC14_2708990 [marine sediment metagenome]|uniref:Uncharacterized protein n=1 Tax=marine sediment metagenome TaxID=412755 RepID=A0A0F8ZDG6_9ZZZZ